jgi:predicted XRE-type DNA-binding protein
VRPNGSIARGKIKVTKRTTKSNGSGKTASKPVRVQKGSGNVFADLGLPHPEQELLKAQLTLQIYRLIRQRGVTQAEAAKVLGIKQPHVSVLMRNRAGSFSVERLMDFLTALGQDVEITIRPARKPRGAVSMMA